MSTDNKLTRSEARERAFILLFALSVNPDMDLIELPEPDDELDMTYDEFAEELVNVTRNNIDEIDSRITSHLTGWTIERLPRTSLTILRLSTAQLLYMKDIPVSVVINEAVELSKHYGDDDDYTFINGALGSIARDL